MTTTYTSMTSMMRRCVAVLASPSRKSGKVYRIKTYFSRQTGEEVMLRYQRTNTTEETITNGESRRLEKTNMHETTPTNTKQPDPTRPDKRTTLRAFHRC
jgi:hypothetical protein